MVFHVRQNNFVNLTYKHSHHFAAFVTKIQFSRMDLSENSLLDSLIM